MEKPNVSAVLALLRPEELWPAWRFIDSQEEMGTLSEHEARRWKESIYRRMIELGLEPDDLTGPPPSDPALSPPTGGTPQ